MRVAVGQNMTVLERKTDVREADADASVATGAAFNLLFFIMLDILTGSWRALEGPRQCSKSIRTSSVLPRMNSGEPVVTVANEIPGRRGLTTPLMAKRIRDRLAKS